MRVLKPLFALVLCLSLLCALPVSARAEDIKVIDEAELQTMMENFISEKGIGSHNISIGFCYTGTGERWYYNADEWYYAGSMYKVPLMMLMAEKVKAGEIQPDENIQGMALDEMSRLILVRSNNEWAHVLRNYLGGDAVWREESKKFSSIADDAYDPDFVDYGYVNPVYVIDVMQELYDNSDSYPGVLELLGEAEPDNYFNRKLGERYEIAQKYGALEEFYHTCGVIYMPTPIILTVMTKNLSGQNQLIGDAAELFADYALTLDERYAQAEKAAAEATPAPTPAPTPEAVPAETPAPVQVSPAPLSGNARTANTLFGIAAYLALAGAALAVILIIIRGLENLSRSIKRSRQRKAARKTYGRKK